jgi:hypothetical protein
MVVVGVGLGDGLQIQRLGRKSKVKEICTAN